MSLGELVRKNEMSKVSKELLSVINDFDIQQVNYLVLHLTAFYGNALIGLVTPVLLILILLALPSLKRIMRVSEAVEFFP